VALKLNRVNAVRFTQARENVLKKVSVKLNLLIALLVLLAPFQTEADESWRFSIEPYVLATSIDGDAGSGRITGAPVNVHFTDILKRLKFGAMIHAEAHHQDGWGLLIDYGFMNLGSDIRGSLGGVVSAGVKQGVLEILLDHRLNISGSSVDVLAGIRWWDNRMDIAVNPAVLPGSVSTSIRASWIDPVIGMRVITPMSDRWSLQGRADIGGFGVGSDFSYQLVAGFDFALSETLSLDMQYKALWVNYTTGKPGAPGYFKYDTVTHGPLIGLILNF